MDAARPTPTVANLLAERAWLRRLAGSLVRNAADADDLTQDTLVAALERAPATVERPRAWLSTVLRNLVRNRHRGGTRRRAREATALHGSGGESPHALVARAELVERVARLVLSLDEPYRTTILLRFFEDEPPARVAERMGVPLETARTRLRRGLSLLAERLDREHGGRAAWAPALALWHAAGAGAEGGAGGLGATVAAGTAGAIVMKKIAVVVALLLLLAGGLALHQGWWSLDSRSSETSGKPELAAADRTSSEPAALAAPGKDQLASTGAATGRGPAVLRGVVVDETGRPAAGIPVYARPLPRRMWPPFSAAPSLGSHPTAGAVFARGSSGADGTFTLEGLPYHDDLEVEAAPPSPRHGSRAWAKALPWLDSHIILRVGPGTGVRGRVLDSGGRGVAAWVAARESAAVSSGRAFGDAGRWTAHHVATDADGRFAIPDVPTGPVDFDATVPDRMARYSKRVTVTAGTEVMLSVDEPGGTVLEGTVRDDLGAPIAGAVLVIISRAERPSVYPELVAVRVISGPDGAYRASGLLAGRLQQIEVTAPGFVAPNGLMGHEMPLPRGETTTFDVTLATEFVVEGIVVDEDGTAVADVEVALVPRLPPGDIRSARLQWAPWTTRTTTDGRFRFGGLPLADVNVGVSGAPADGSEGGSVLVAKPTEGRRATGVRLVLRRAGAARTDVRGTVAGIDGRPMAGAAVTATAGTAAPDSPRYVNVDRDGTFVVPGLDATLGWRLMANAPGYASEAIAIPSSGEAGPPIHLVLRPERRIVGRVVSHDGMGVGDLTVRASSGGEGRLEAPTAFDGTFRVGPLASGTWALEVRDAVGTSAGEETKVVVTEGNATTSVTLRIGERHALGGTIVDGNGRPIQGLQVGLRSLESGGPYTYTDAEGRFEFLLLGPGPFSMAIQGQGIEGTYAADRTDHRIVWKKASRIPVEVLLVPPAGERIEGGTVWFRTGERMPDGTRSSGSGARAGGGRFWVDLEPEETVFDLEVVRVDDAAGRRINARPVIVRDLRVRDSPITIRLERGREVRVLVLGAEDEPLPGVEVYVGPSGHGGWTWWSNPFTEIHRGRTGAGGVFLAAGLPEKDVVLAVKPPAGYVEPRATALGPENEVTVRLERGVRIAGVVVDETGRAVGDAQVEVHRSRGIEPTRGDDPLAPASERAGWTAVTDASGRFAVDGLPRGSRFTVRAAVASPLLLPAVLDDVAGGRDDVRLSLEVGTFVEGEVVGSGWGEESGLEVELRRVEETWPARHGPPVAAARLTGGRTAFRVEPVVPGTYQLLVRDPSYHEPLITKGVTAPATGLRVELPAARHVVGRVAGGDLLGFRLLVRFEENSLETTLEPDGRFRILNARDGPVTVVAWREGNGRMGYAEGVDPTAGPIVLPLREGSTIEGRIEGLPDGQDTTVDAQAYGPLGQRRGTASPDGGFRFVGLPPHSSWRVLVWCHAPGAQARQLEAHDVLAGTRDLVLRYDAK